MRKGCVQWSLSEAEGDFIEAGVGWEDIVRISWLNEIAKTIEWSGVRNFYDEAAFEVARVTTTGCTIVDSANPHRRCTAQRSVTARSAYPQRIDIPLGTHV